VLTLFRCDNCAELAQEERNPSDGLMWVKCTGCNMARPALSVIEADPTRIPPWWRNHAIPLPYAAGHG
jgi:hypothetical protein